MKTSLVVERPPAEKIFARQAQRTEKATKEAKKPIEM